MYTHKGNVQHVFWEPPVYAVALGGKTQEAHVELGARPSTSWQGLWKNKSFPKAWGLRARLWALIELFQVSA